MFSSSVGMKLLIGVTGSALVRLSDHPHRRQPDGVLRPRRLQQIRVHARKQSADSGHRDRAAADLPGSRVQDGADVPARTRQRGPSRYARRSAPGAPSRKTLASSTMIVSGLWLLAVHHHSRQGVPVRDRVRLAGRRARSLSARDGELRQPADGRLLRAEHAGRRLAPLARHLELASVAWPRPSAVDAARARPPAKVVAVAHRRRLHRHRALGAFRRSAGHERIDAGREDPCRPARREMGPPQVRDEAGQPGQQAQVHDHRRRHRPGRRRRRPRRSASSATTS